MIIKYDNKCRECDDGIQIHDEQEEACATCEGYGYLLTSNGYELVQFLKRRGVNFSMSPIAEDELRGMIE